MALSGHQIELGNILFNEYVNIQNGITEVRAISLTTKELNILLQYLSLCNKAHNIKLKYRNNEVMLKFDAVNNQLNYDLGE